MTAPPADPETVGPVDCGLCVGIPLERAEVLAQMTEPDRFGYVPGIMSDRAVTTRAADDLWAYYASQVAAPVAALCRKLEGLGAAVSVRADLDAVVEMAALRPVVLFLTHWEAPPIRAEEVTDPEGFVGAAETGTHWVHREVCDGLRPRTWWGRRRDFRSGVVAARRAGTLLHFLVTGLNRLITAARAARDRAFERAERTGRLTTGPTAAPVVTRVLVEREFRPFVRHGRCLETATGMVTAWNLLNRLGPDRQLVLDLTLCNSTEFAELVRLARPRTRVIGHYHSADAVGGALLVGETFNLLAERPRPYLEARALAVHRVLDRIGRPK